MLMFVFYLSLPHYYVFSEWYVHAGRYVHDMRFTCVLQAACKGTHVIHTYMCFSPSIHSEAFKVLEVGCHISSVASAVMSEADPDEWAGSLGSIE